MKIKVIKCDDPAMKYSTRDFPFYVDDVYQASGSNIYVDRNDCCEYYKMSDCEIADKEATKADKGKVSYSSIPQLALLEVAKGFTHGKNKYGLFNYSGKMNVLRYIDALDRHKTQYLINSDKDDIDESGIHHLALVACNALMALDSIITNKSVDDRNKVYTNNENDE